jgi:hypothetical protein
MMVAWSGKGDCRSPDLHALVVVREWGNRRSRRRGWGAGFIFGAMFEIVASGGASKKSYRAKVTPTGAEAHVHL